MPFLYDSHVGEIDRLKLDADAHELILILDQLALAIDLLLHEVVPHELLNLLIQVLDLNVLALDHAVEILVLQLELICSL